MKYEVKNIFGSDVSGHELIWDIDETKILDFKPLSNKFLIKEIKEIKEEQKIEIKKHKSKKSKKIIKDTLYSKQLNKLGGKNDKTRSME